MNNSQTNRPTLSRRQFLTLAGAAGLTAAAGYVLVEAAPWLDYD
jgi:hypothetical protein